VEGDAVTVEFRREPPGREAEPSALAAQASAALDAGNPGRAAKLCTRSLRLEPCRHEAWFGLAKAEGKRGDDAAARAAALKAARLCPRQTAYVAELADVAAGANDAAAAERLARLTLQLDSRHPFARQTLSWAFAASGRTEEALAELREEARLHPNSSKPLFLLAGHLLKLGRPEEALRAFQEFLRLESQSPSLPPPLEVVPLLHYKIQMELAERNAHAVASAAERLKQRIEADFGYPVRITAQTPVNSSIYYAEDALSFGLGCHTVQYEPSLPEPFRRYVIAHALMLILAACEAEAVGKGSCSDVLDRLCRRHDPQLDIRALDPAALPLVVRVLVHLLKTALEMTVFVREQALHPDFAPAQFLTFHAVQRATSPSPSEVMDAPSDDPRELRRAVIALDCVQAMQLDAAWHLATDYTGAFRATEAFPLARQLWDRFLANQPGSGPGDAYRLALDFAEVMGLCPAPSKS
jgi:Flp pilus assembly protein TadD